MINKIYKGILLCSVLLFMVSCGDGDNDIKIQFKKLSVQLESEKPIENYEEFTIVVKELKTGEEIVEKANKEGQAVFTLPLGDYSISAEDVKDGVSTMVGKKETFTFSDDTSVQIKLVPIESTLEKTFVLDELYFNCSSRGEYNNSYYEAYFTIRNISNKPLYIDGLSFGITGDYNVNEPSKEMSAYLQDHLVISQMYTIPGNGREHLLQPNQSVVIAHSAIDHSEGGKYPKSPNLSGADFEIYVEHEYVMTKDNPDVKNVLVDFSTFEAFHWQNSGSAPLVLFRIDGDHETYLKEHIKEFSNPGSYMPRPQNYLIIPSSSIIDGVETGIQDHHLQQVLPLAVDKGTVLIPGTGFLGQDGFKGYFLKRKSMTNEDGVVSVQDTNNSTDDYVVTQGNVKSYPKK